MEVNKAYDLSIENQLDKPRKLAKRADHVHYYETRECAFNQKWKQYISYCRDGEDMYISYLKQ